MSNKALILFETFIKKYEVIFVLGNHETKIQIENRIALETIIPESIKDSKNAKNKTNNQAYSAFAFKYISIFSNIGYLFIIKDNILLYFLR